MSDLAKYVQDRAARDPEFADDLESGYADFKVGALLRQAREKAGLTQEEVAERLDTKKSAISRIENSAGSIRFSTLERYARAIGWQLSLELRPPRKSSAHR
ncbi:MAG TPA: helix-turn-helix transcriptional regulator [Thermoanaerobaculia bacterium]|nr:helix-turn-helix transcriptional regulator [Thermoanaerobaculia bacterium]